LQPLQLGDEARHLQPMITIPIPHDAPREVASWYFPLDLEEDELREALCRDIEDLISGAKHGVGRADIERVAQRYFPEGGPLSKELRDALSGEIEELVEEARQAP
jgi:hypothetical protein